MAKKTSTQSLKDGEDKMQMKKQLGLLEGVAIILGIIFGSGTLRVLFPSGLHVSKNFKLIQRMFL